MAEYRRSAQAVTDLKYHVIGVTKYTAQDSAGRHRAAGPRVAETDQCGAGSDDRARSGLARSHPDAGVGASALLLAPTVGDSPDAAAVRVDAPADLGAARADRLTGGGCHGVRLGEDRTQGGSGLREMSSGTRHRTNSSPPGGRHHGAITAPEEFTD